jgi:hypothetical protein
MGLSWRRAAFDVHASIVVPVMRYWNAVSSGFKARAFAERVSAILASNDRSTVASVIRTSSVAGATAVGPPS